MRRRALLLVTAPAASLLLVATAATGAQGSVGPSASAPGAFSLSTTRTPDGTLHMNRWNPCQRAITYRVNVAAAGSTRAARSAAVVDVKTAFSLLGRATGMTFTYRGTTSFVPGAGWAQRLTDAEIVVAWVDPVRQPSTATLLGRSNGGWAAGTGGFASKSWSSGRSWSSVIGRGYVVVNARQSRAFRPGFGGGVTRGALLLHELGHVVGLRHVSSAAQLMYPTIVARPSTSYRSGDLAGLARLGARAGCIDVPVSVWRDL